MINLGFMLLGFLLGFYIKGFHVPDMAVVAGFLTGRVIGWGMGAALTVMLAPALKRINKVIGQWRILHFRQNHKGINAAKCLQCNPQSL
jgi:hypothetical protein